MDNNSIRVPAIRVHQPIGDFYLASIKSSELVSISTVDMRRIEGELDRYVGIQRKLSKDRVKEIASFVNSIDAVFPSSVVLSIPGVCATFDEHRRELVIAEAHDEQTGELIKLEEVANILDGQHRVEGLKGYEGDEFDVPVSVFVNADIADQAYIFATVNLAQTKVNKSLVYDLLDYSKARSPQKTCHDVAVALDLLKTSPFYHLIKRLGTATPGRSGETLAQATFVGALLPFLTKNPEEDRYRMAKGKSVRVDDTLYAQTPFRWLWVKERDSDIARIVNEYFSAVRERWPRAWESREAGSMLSRTNGFRAFMRFLKEYYLHEKRSPDLVDPVLSKDVCLTLLRRVRLDDGDFNIDRYLPGTSGETSLFKDLREFTGI